MIGHRRAPLRLSLAIIALGTAISSAYGQAANAQPSSPMQGKTNSHNRVTSQQSITVEAHLTPQEKEDGEINEVYQPVYAIQEEHDCKGAVEKYRTEVIPLAERAKFDVPKNKFLFLAYRGIGDCDMELKNYVAAEEIFQKLFEYLPVWPGTDDSDYPINFRSLGLARMAQEKWEDAEAPLQKSVAIFDEQISRASKSDSDFARNEMANDYRLSQDSAMYFLAVVYYREKRNAEALRLLERAYDQAIQFHAPATIVKRMVDIGLDISISAGDLNSGAAWSTRALGIN